MGKGPEMTPFRKADALSPPSSPGQRVLGTGTVEHLRRPVVLPETRGTNPAAEGRRGGRGSQPGRSGTCRAVLGVTAEGSRAIRKGTSETPLDACYVPLLGNRNQRDECTHPTRPRRPHDDNARRRGNSQSACRPARTSGDDAPSPGRHGPLEGTRSVLSPRRWRPRLCSGDLGLPTPPASRAPTVRARRPGRGRGPLGQLRAVMASASLGGSVPHVSPPCDAGGRDSPLGRLV